MMIKVSVIIPIYNVEKYIKQCIESIVNQTLNEIEIICINDCSTDNSLNILNEYARNDKRIIIVNNESNIGSGKSRNIGMNLARGKYLSIIDADDFCHLEMLEILYRESEYNNIDIAVNDYARFDDKSKTWTYINVPMSLSKKNCSTIFNPKHIPSHIFQMIDCAPFTKFYNRSFVLESKIKFQDLENSNDVFFGNLILTQAKKIIYVNTNEPIYYYRVNVRTQISNNRSKNTKCILKALFAMKEELIKKNIFDMYKISFNSYVISCVIYNLSSISNEVKNEFVNSINNKWLKKMNMLNCKKEEFRNSYDYNLYKLIYDNDEEKLCSIYPAENMYNDYEKTIKLYEYLNKNNYKCGLWGVGIFGTAFLDLCRTNNYKIECLIDTNSIKQGCIIEGYEVKSFEDISGDINAVIVTNSRYTCGIYNLICRSEKKITLIDIDAYYRGGYDIVECTFECK